MLKTKICNYANLKATNKFFKSTSTTEFDKKLEHYRNLNALQNTDSKPKGWDEAKPFDSIPGPKPLPVVGNKWRFILPKIGDFYGKDFVQVHRELRKKYGDLVLLKGLMDYPLLTLFDPKDFETLIRNEGVWPFRRNLESSDYYRHSKKDIYPLGLLVHQGEEWFKIRTLVNPILMQPKNVAQYTEKMSLVADELVDNMKQLAKLNKNGEMPENFTNELHKWALESVGVITLDTHLGCLKQNLASDSEPQKMISSAIQVFELMYKLDILPSMWKYFSTPDWKQYNKVLDFLMETNKKHINRALDELEKEGDSDKETRSILQQLLKKDRNVAIAMAIDMMLAGIDTTGRVLGAGLYFLAKNPEKQEKLKDEARSLLTTKDAPITKEILSKASYLKAVIKEVTRFAPIAMGNTRTSTKDLVLGGYQVPKGTEFLTSNLILCHDDENFPKAKEFIPERWLSSAPAEISHKSANPFIHAPFGYGSRSCIGKRLANLELEVALFKIVRNFDLKWPHEEMTFTTTVLYGMTKPLKIHVKDSSN